MGVTLMPSKMEVRAKTPRVLVPQAWCADRLLMFLLYAESIRLSISSHWCSQQRLPQHQVRCRVLGRRDHELREGVIQQLCHQEEGRDRACGQGQPLRH